MQALDQCVKLHNRGGDAGQAGAIIMGYRSQRPMARITEADQFPAHVDLQRKGDNMFIASKLVKITTLPDGTRVETLRNGVVGRFTRKDDGTTRLKMRWNSKWWEIPSMQQVQAWTLDSVCETPAGDIIEPDADGSWLRLLNLV